jgi:hypothetical protein
MPTDKKSMWKDRLTQAKTELENLLLSLDEAQLHTPVITEGNGWTPLDILAHLLENERGMSIHIYKIRQGRETVPEDFSLEKWNAGLKERMGTDHNLAELLDNLAQVRTRTLQELDSLKDDEWALTGRHPDRGLITIEQYYETMASHMSWHAQDIKKGLGL